MCVCVFFSDQKKTEAKHKSFQHVLYSLYISKLTIKNNFFAMRKNGSPSNPKVDDDEKTK
jgi:hypothetical protein